MDAFGKTWCNVTSFEVSNNYLPFKFHYFTINTLGVIKGGGIRPTPFTQAKETKKSRSR